MPRPRDISPLIPARTLGVTEVGALFRCDYKVVCELARSGKLRGAKIGRAWVFREDDVHEYLNEQIRRQTESRKPMIVTRKGGRPRNPVPVFD